ncbi:Bug family tripartite tricarboxylate transporter substrate binding protein [Roseococcus pinisoli]|uniref:Tripartite tricarboxylate transporter substrate binding protein n=1 Tax=Roseococcus pinisoli TaxID=2835040 RepID=A0ABS5Q7M8_9PROT|nr:tripartite tricarboxylate transporter substrate binding protein [Roseococcus pinisoli]MBS7809670.1 tripartite tricarboxylate transporter substrate binding protein [Roseococcus pinisoli]
MLFPRRLLLPSLAAVPTVALAIDLPPGWPDRPLRFILPAAGGAGTADTLARILAQEMDKRLPQRTLVDNRPGANGNVGATAAARAAPDGHTILFTWAGTMATNPALYRDLPYDPRRDFEPVILLGNVPNVLVVNNALPVHSLAELTDYLKTHPGQVSFGSSGNGSSMHLAGELYRQATGTEMVHVPYNGIGQGFTDLFAGRIQVMFNLVTGAQPQIRAGQVRPIAVLSDRRSVVLPEVPTTAELGMPGLEFGSWFCLMLPRRTPAPIAQALNALVNEILQDPEGRQRLEAQGLDIIGGEPGRLSALLESELQRHAALVRFAGLSLQ